MYASKTYDTPLLTSNGTMGGSSFAVFGGGTATNGDVWNAFDGDPATYYRADATLANQYIIMYFPTPLFLVDLNIKSLYNSTSHNEWGSIATGEIDGSNDNSTWVKVSDISNSMRGAYTIIVNSTTAYKYYRLKPATFLSDTILHIAELKIIARYNDEDTSVIGTDKDKITANNLNEVTTYANKVNTIAGSILSVSTGVAVGNISKPTDLSNIQNAINNLENLLSLNCCQQGAGDCCQGCQTIECQSSTCQTQTCQSTTCQTCQGCQSSSCQSQCSECSQCYNVCSGNDGN